MKTKNAVLKSFSLVTCLMWAAASATAAPVAYDISFTSVFSSSMSGSFVYDSTTRVFSAFTVNFAGDVINLTSAANNPNIAATCSSQVDHTTPTDVQDYFSFLAGTAPAACGERSWIAFGLAGTLPPAYRFRVGTLEAFAAADHSAGAGQMAGLIDSGRFTISAVAEPAAAPEPSSSLLMLAGGLLLWSQRRKRA